MVAYDTWHAPVRECVCEAVRLTLFACTLLFGYLLGYLVSVACFPPQNQMSCHCMSFTKVRPVEVLDQSLFVSFARMILSDVLHCTVPPLRAELFPIKPRYSSKVSLSVRAASTALSENLRARRPQVLTLTR